MPNVCTYQRISLSERTSMSNYFHARKRKLGIATLIAVCVLTSGWIRSRTNSDSILFARGSVGHRLSSIDGNIELWINKSATIDSPIRVESKPLVDRRLIIEQNLKKRKQAVKKRLEALQRAKGTLSQTQFEEIENRIKESLRALDPFCTIPYVIIVIPVTLLSAWLLLSKLGENKIARQTV